eukprot:scaffold236239_cov43-Tisochrysis_lutea.AAC.2
MHHCRSHLGRKRIDSTREHALPRELRRPKACRSRRDDQKSESRQDALERGERRLVVGMLFHGLAQKDVGGAKAERLAERYDITEGESCQPVLNDPRQLQACHARDSQCSCRPRGARDGTLRRMKAMFVITRGAPQCVRSRGAEAAPGRFSESCAAPMGLDNTAAHCLERAFAKVGRRRTVLDLIKGTTTDWSEQMNAHAPACEPIASARACAA